MGLRFQKLNDVKKVRNKYHSFLGAASRVGIYFSGDGMEKIQDHLRDEYVAEASKAIDCLANRTVTVADIAELKHAL